MAIQPSNSASPFGTFAPGLLFAAVMRLTQRCGAGWWGKRHAFFWRGVSVALRGGKPVDVERFGCRMRLYPSHNTTEKNLLFTPQFFDREEREILLRELNPEFTFADVGANVGGYALFVTAHAGPHARIVAIEPQPDVFERLSFNIAQNGFSQIAALNCAVSDREGDVTLYLNAANKGESSILEATAGATAKQVTVKAFPLGRLLADAALSRLDAMKIDVEGVEGIILENLFTTAPESLWPRLLIVEDAPTRWTQDVPSLILRRGYTLIAKTRTNLIYRRVAST